MEVIILAGGLGTRLQGVIGAAPKCMAPVNGLPFLHYVFAYLEKEKCTRAILSLGHKHDVVTEWLETQQLPFDVSYVIEHEPLGTGGGIRLAMQEAKLDDVVVLNGDTMFNVTLSNLYDFHLLKKAETSLALKEMRNFDRYGVVNTDEDDVITSFEEKKFRELGMINGGVYMINRHAFLQRELAQKFSFEKDYLERYVEEGTFYGYAAEDYFIDIGIPADYEQAQHDFKTLFA